MKLTLGTLPASTSPRFSLNTIDFEKLFRDALTWALGYFVTFGVPYLLGRKWVIDGTDYTALVGAITPLLANAARRFLSAAPKE